MQLDNAPVSADGRENTVWCFAKADDQGEIYHFINLMGTDTGWRDEKQLKKEPAELAPARTRLYTDYPARAVYLASRMARISPRSRYLLRQGRTRRACCIEFTQPRLLLEHDFSALMRMK